MSSLNFDIFTLTKESMAGVRYFNIGRDNTTLNGANWDQPGFYADGNIARRNNTGGLPFLGVPTGSPAFSNTAPNIMYNTFTNTFLSKGLNGGANGTGSTHGAIGAVTGGHLFGANYVGGAGGDDVGFIGNIGELIIYGNGSVTSAERNKVDSYLAIKYGVTLNSSNNYTTSEDVVVWNAAANAGFYSNVAGVGNDFLSALVQKQSRSQHVNTNGQVTMGLGTIAETNLANTNSLSSGQFLIWGDNGNTTAMTNTASTYTSFNYAGGTNNGRRMNRTWKVQNTNVSGQMLVRFPVASVGTTTLSNGDACAQYAIIFASDAAFMTNLTVVPLTLNGTDYEISHSFPTGSSFFTFGKATPLGTGIVYLPAVTENTTTYNNNCNVGEWVNFTKTGDLTQKLLGVAGYTTTEVNNFAVTITPQGTIFDNGMRQSQLMPRISTITNNNSSPLSTGKVRIYFSQDELTATQLPGALTNGWFKYEGNADDVISDLYDDGYLVAANAIAIVPAVTGVEDGVNFVEFHNISSMSSFVYISTTAESPLPVRLVNFTARKEGNVAMLNWTSLSESNSAGFEIQRSDDAKNWVRLGFTKSKSQDGNSGEALEYYFADATPLSGNNYYRLKQLDIDGTFAYGKIATLDFSENAPKLTLYPNPVTGGKLNIQLDEGSAHDIEVYNVSGTRVMNLKTSGKELDVTGLTSGVYVLRLYLSSGSVYSRTFVVK